MSEMQEGAQDRPRPETGRVHYALEMFGVFSFFVLALLLAEDVFGGMLGGSPLPSKRRPRDASSGRSSSCCASERF